MIQKYRSEADKNRAKRRDLCNQNGDVPGFVNELLASRKEHGEEIFGEH